MLPRSTTKFVMFMVQVRYRTDWPKYGSALTAFGMSKAVDRVRQDIDHMCPTIYYNA